MELTKEVLKDFSRDIQQIIKTHEPQGILSTMSSQISEHWQKALKAYAKAEDLIRNHSPRTRAIDLLVGSAIKNENRAEQCLHASITVKREIEYGALLAHEKSLSLGNDRFRTLDQADLNHLRDAFNREIDTKHMFGPKDFQGLQLDESRQVLRFEELNTLKSWDMHGAIGNFSLVDFRNEMGKMTAEIHVGSDPILSRLFQSAGMFDEKTLSHEFEMNGEPTKNEIGNGISSSWGDSLMENKEIENDFGMEL